MIVIKRHSRIILFIILIGLIVFNCSKETDNTPSMTEDLTIKSVGYKDSRLSYTDSETADTTLLFVHGSFINKRYWESQVNYFSPHYRVITIDLPGHGRSTRGSDSLNIQNFGNTLVSFINGLKLQKVILIGHSMGADVILEVAVKNPEPVIGLIAVDYFKNVGTPLPGNITNQVLAGLKTDFKKTLEQYVRQGLVTAATDSTLVNRVVNDYRSMEPIGGIQSITDGFNYTKRESELLGKLKFKINLLNVDYMPTNEAHLKKYMTSGYQLTTIHDTSHFPMIENPDQFNNALKQLITQIGN